MPLPRGALAAGLREGVVAGEGGGQLSPAALEKGEGVEGKPGGGDGLRGGGLITSGPGIGWGAAFYQAGVAPGGGSGDGSR